MTLRELIAVQKGSAEWDGTADELAYAAASEWGEIRARHEREACAALVETLTARRRFVRSAVNGERLSRPCEYADAIRNRSK